MMRSLFLLLVFWVTMVAIHAQSRQYPPRNEVSQDESLNRFITDLLGAIGRKDEAFLMQALDDDIMTGFDGSGGKATFNDMWEPQREDSKLWPLLSRLIHMGGVFLHDASDETGRHEFVFPYVYNMDMELEDDPYTIGVITGQHVNLRKEPDTKAPVVTQLTYDVITFLYSENDDDPTQAGRNEWGEPEWYKIMTIDGQYTGWVFWKYVYSPIHYRMFLFKDKKGLWKIATLVAGD